MKSYLVTVSDDRMGRKAGSYRETQLHIHNTFVRRGVPNEMIFHNHYAFTIDDILKTDFYLSNKAMIDCIDPARNGRVYKPYVISEVLKQMDNGDLLVYTDCSPEMWRSFDPCWFRYQGHGDCDLNNLYKLCEMNECILTNFVRWDTRPMEEGELGIHTHRNFTTDLCMNAMEVPELFRNSYQHASGMIVIIKNRATVDFVEEWLYHNCDDRCASLGRVDVPGDYSYWTEREQLFKMGHRHDQSISGLLMNKYNRSLIHLTKFPIVHNPYIFINHCYSRVGYTLVNSNEQPEEGRIQKGDPVTNKQGHILRVFEIWEEDGEEVYRVGFHPESCYKAYIEDIKPL